MSKKRKLDSEDKEAPPSCQEAVGEKPRKFWGCATLFVQYTAAGAWSRSLDFPGFASTKNEVIGNMLVAVVVLLKEAGVIDEKTIKSVIAPLEWDKPDYRLVETRMIYEKVVAYLNGGHLPKDVKYTHQGMHGWEVTETGVVAFDPKEFDVIR